MSHEEENDHNHKDEKKEHGAEDRYPLEPEKAYPIGEFIIVAKFGDHVSHHLASRVVNVIRQRGRQTKNLVLAISFKNSYLSFYNSCTVLCTISGLKQFN